MSNDSTSVELSLLPAVERFIGIEVQPLEWLDGGDEAIVLRAATTLGDVVIHASPIWRTYAELEWVHAVSRHAHLRISEAIAPVECSGQTMFEWKGRIVAVFPFVVGEFLDRDDAILRANAACLLAAIHKSLLDFSGGVRPGFGVGSPATPAQEPGDIQDPDLDAWWYSARRRGLEIGPTHGDYYRRNLLCSDHRIIGVIDWHDASVRPLALELAQATFEICRNDKHALQFDRANEFVAIYRAAGGPIPAHDIELLLTLIRVWIREDVRWSLASGSDVCDDYIVKQMRAFRQLSNCEWVPG